MRYESTMMMAGPTTIATHQPTGVAPSQLQRQSSSSHIYQLQTSPSRPSLAHQYSSSSSSSQQHPSQSQHRRSSRRGSHQHLPVQQAQPQFLFYPQIVPYQQMPYHQQLPYQHQRMHNLLHGGSGGANFVLPYNNPYLAQSASQANLVQPGLSRSQSRQLSSGQSRNHLHAHAHRRHLLPNAPPSSQQHSSSSSFSSQQQLQQATQGRKAQSQKAQKALSVQSPQSTSTNMPLFSGFSLRGKRRKEELAAKEPFMVQVKHLEKAAAPNTAQKTQAKTEPFPKMAPSSTTRTTRAQMSASMIKPPARDKVDPPSRNRGPVDAQDLTKRLQNVLAERERKEAATNGPASTTSPRIKSRGSGNLRAAYASNGTSPGLRRQPFSAPHNLAGMAPPMEAPHKGRTRSLSPQSSQALQQASMRGGGGSKTKAESSTLAQKRAVTSVIPPTNAHHGVPYVPSQAAQQFARTTVVVGGSRKSILLQKPRQGSASGGPGQSQPYSHNQVARSPPLPEGDKDKEKDKAKSSASSAKSPTAPSVQHAFKDTLVEPGSRRQSMKEGEPNGGAEGAEVVPEMAVDVDESGDADVSASGDDDAKSKSSKAAKKPLVPQSDFRRIVQEHSVDWTQSDETSNHRKREKKEKKEREKREKRERKEKEKEKAKQEEEPKGESGGRPLWRLKARLSSFSKDKQAPSPPAAVPVVEEKEETVAEAEEPKVEAAPEEPLEAPPAIAADTAEPTSHSSSVLSLTNLAKSASFLSRFKH